MFGILKDDAENIDIKATDHTLPCYSAHANDVRYKTHIDEGAKRALK